MTFTPVGHPDWQDDGSFVAGFPGPVFSMAPAPAHSVASWSTVGDDGFTSAVGFLFDVGFPMAAIIRPKPAGSAGSYAATTELLLPTGGDIFVPAQHLGHGFDIDVYNLGSSPGFGSVSSFNFFKASTPDLVNPRISDQGGDMALPDTETFTLPVLYASIYDQCNYVIASDKDASVDAVWYWPTNNAGSWELTTATEPLTAITAGGVSVGELPIRGWALDLVVTNDDGADDAVVSAAYHLHRLS